MTAGLKTELKKRELELLDREQDIRNLELKIEDLKEKAIEIRESILELKIKPNAWRNNPDPYNYHGIPISTILKEMEYPI